MALERIRHKSGIAGIGGGAQCVTGAVVCAMGLLVMLLPSRPDSIPRYILYCLAALVVVWGLRWIVRGMNTRRLLRLLGELDKMFQSKNRVPLQVAAEYLHCTVSRLVTDVRAIQGRGYVTGLYADLIRQDLVSAPGGVDLSGEPDTAQETVVLTEETRASVVPIYALGLTWVLWALGLPLYKLSHFILCIAASIVVFVLARAKSADEVVIVERRKAPPAPVRTGNEELDEMLAAAAKHMDDLRRLDREITTGKGDEVVREILRTTEQIVEHVKAHPNSANQIRQFLNYTLPTTIGLLQNYRDLSRQRVQGENITQAKEKIEGMMDTILAAYHRQLDALFRDKALDIEVELDVMKGMFEQQAHGNDFGANDFGGSNTP